MTLTNTGQICMASSTIILLCRNQSLLLLLVQNDQLCAHMKESIEALEQKYQELDEQSTKQKR